MSKEDELCETKRELNATKAELDRCILLLKDSQARLNEKLSSSKNVDEIQEGVLRTEKLALDVKQKEIALTEADNEVVQLKLDINELQQLLNEKGSEASAKLMIKTNEIKEIGESLSSTKTELELCQLKLQKKEAEIKKIKEETLHEKKLFNAISPIKYDQVENVSDPKIFRNQIISLALSLERSELQRADTLDRIMNERKAHAESLKRFGDSVKRFYSTLSYGNDGEDVQGGL